MSEGPLASTMIDVFDSKSRMRQGTFNLYLWKGKELDMSTDCTTPGLFYDKPENLNFYANEAPQPNGESKDQDNFIEINQLLQKIHYYHKKEKCEDFKEWIDKTSHETIF